MYMALPSPSSAITILLGQAIAAPVATGNPKPIDPPQLLSQACGLEHSVKGKNSLPVVIDSSTIMAFSGINFPSTNPIVWGLSWPVGFKPSVKTAILFGFIKFALIYSHKFLSPSPTSSCKSPNLTNLVF